MKRIIETLGCVMLIAFTVLLSGCKYPALGGGGWFIPVAALILGIWSFARWKFGWFKPEAKGNIFALIAACVCAALFVIYIISAIASK